MTSESREFVSPVTIAHPDTSGIVALLAHIPHASTYIPPQYREQILLDDDELRRELLRVTDLHVDTLFSWVPRFPGIMHMASLSRLVFDAERFAEDEREPMSAVGQGVVYTKTSDGRPLQNITPEEREYRIQNLYRPYHGTLTEPLQWMLDNYEFAYLIDCHSFPTVPLPSDLDQDPDRPDICLGTDDFHTPEIMTATLKEEFEERGLRVELNRPYPGVLVPESLWQRDQRLSAIMIEVRRGLYCDESTGAPNERFREVAEILHRAVHYAVREATKELVQPDRSRTHVSAPREPTVNASDLRLRGSSRTRVPRTRG